MPEVVVYNDVSLRNTDIPLDQTIVQELRNI